MHGAGACRGQGHDGTQSACLCGGSAAAMHCHLRSPIHLRAHASRPASAAPALTLTRRTKRVGMGPSLSTTPLAALQKGMPAWMAPFRSTCWGGQREAAAMHWLGNITVGAVRQAARAQLPATSLQAHASPTCSRMQAHSLARRCLGSLSLWVGTECSHVQWAMRQHQHAGQEGAALPLRAKPTLHACAAHKAKRPAAQPRCTWQSGCAGGSCAAARRFPGSSASCGRARNESAQPEISAAKQPAQRSSPRRLTRAGHRCRLLRLLPLCPAACMAAFAPHCLPTPLQPCAASLLTSLERLHGWPRVPAPVP